MSPPQLFESPGPPGLPSCFSLACLELQNSLRAAPLTMHETFTRLKQQTPTREKIVAPFALVSSVDPGNHCRKSQEEPWEPGRIQEEPGGARRMHEHLQSCQSACDRAADRRTEETKRIHEPGERCSTHEMRNQF